MYIVLEIDQAEDLLQYDRNRWRAIAHRTPSSSWELQDLIFSPNEITEHLEKLRTSSDQSLSYRRRWGSERNLTKITKGEAHMILFTCAPLE